MKAIVECPYCEAEVKISSEDWPIADGQEASFTCPKCEMHFMFLLEISYTLTPKKAACLNGEEHTKGKSSSFVWQIAKGVLR